MSSLLRLYHEVRALAVYFLWSRTKMQDFKNSLLFHFPRSPFYGKKCQCTCLSETLVYDNNSLLPGGALLSPLTVLEWVQVKEKDAKVWETPGAELLSEWLSLSSLSNSLSFNHHRARIPRRGKHHVIYAFCNLSRV